VWESHDFAALILSPGIPHLYPAPHPIVTLAWKYGAFVNNDIGLFFREFSDFWLNLEKQDEPWPEAIAITGSNGKSTTTALIAHILEKAGKKVQMGGNIGRGVLDLDPPEKGTVYVLELSSYQTELADELSPTIAVFLNFSPDHFDRHGGHGGYFAAKRRLFDMSMPGRAIIGVDEDEGRFIANSEMQTRYGDPVTRISVERELQQKKGWSVYVQDGILIDWSNGNEVERLDVSQMPSLAGVHNHQNMASAFAVCKVLELARDEIVAGFASFPGLPHRMETVGQLGSVTFVNDSKATNVEATAKALEAFENIYWIAGGQGKEGGLEGLSKFLPNINKAYLIGEAAEGFAEFLGSAPGSIAHELSGTLDKAVERAVLDATGSGGVAVVLLAPACASFDQFPSFEHRGNAFREQVLAHINKDKA
jgi:UDP-N-acetylmuramoylalanine--D-glutamate ligase